MSRSLPERFFNDNVSEPDPWVSSVGQLQLSKPDGVNDGVNDGIPSEEEYLNCDELLFDKLKLNEKKTYIIK